MSFALDGLASGLSTTELINRLLQLERAPQNRLVAAKTAAQKQITAFQGINARLAAVRTMATDLAKPSSWRLMSATSSAEAVATASASGTALPGSLTFTVDQLAKAGGLASSGTVSSLSEVIAGGTLLVGSTDPAPLGIASVKGNGDLDDGEHTIEVTQASAAASRSGDSAIVAAITIDASSDTLDVTVNGVAQVWSIANSTYNTAAELVTAVQTAADAAGGGVTVDLDMTGAIRFTTVAEGSDAAIQFTGGNALNAFDINDLTQAAGTDGIIEVDGQATTITDAQNGASYTLTSGTGGTFDITLSGGLDTGTWTGTAIDVGTGTLSDVVAGINAADQGFTAAAVQVATSSYRLQLTASETGVDNDLMIDVDTFASTGLGSLLRTQDALDAEITVGTGPGAYTIASATNAVTDALPGVTITVKGVGETTITITRDADKLADKVSSLVGAANSALNDIKTQTAYDAETRVAGVLLGNFGVRSLQSKLLTAVIDPVITSALNSGGLAGVSVTKTGTLSFDRSKFLAAYADDPEAVEAIFVQGGQADSSSISLASAHDKTRAGTYAIEITTAAEQAQRVGNTIGGGTITADETIDIRVGGATGTTVSYTATAGETLTSIAAELNERLAGENIGVVVTVESNALVVRTKGYGDGATFEVRTSVIGAGQTGLGTVADTYAEYAGLDVQGTINGVAGIGTGQQLAAPAGDEEIGGLVLLVEATAAEVALSTDFGDFTYVPGIAQRLAQVSHDAIDSVIGSLTTLVEGRNTEIERINDQIERWDVRLKAKETQLRRQFAAMEVALQQMNSQSQWLAGQIQQLNANIGIGRDR